MDRSSNRNPSDPAPEITYTRTGRISKAKKGIRNAHICACGKSYSRAEHLRRHQQNHGPTLHCSFANCGKTFHRQDLLQRHEEKHTQQAQTGAQQPARHHPVPGFTSGPDLSPNFSTTVPPASSSYVSMSPYVPGTPMPPLAPQNYPPSMSSDPRFGGMPSTQSYSSGDFRRPSSVSGPFPSPSFSDHKDYSQAGAQKLQIRPNVVIPHSPAEIAVGSMPGPWSASTHYSSSSGYASPWQTYQLPYFEQSVPPELVPNRSSSVSFVDSWNPEYPTVSVSPASTQSPFHWAMSTKSPSTTSTSTSPAFSYKASMPRVIASSQRYSTHVPTYSNGSWEGSSVQDSGDEVDTLLEGQQLPVGVNIHKKNSYISAYWKHFHPLFPVLHSYTHKTKKPSPLLQAAIVSIGAFYSGEPHAERDSKILHEKTVQGLAKTTFGLTSMDDMQAIYLIELFSQHKSRRAPRGLSSQFVSMFQQVRSNHFANGMQLLTNEQLRQDPENTTPVTPVNPSTNPLDDDILQRQWQRWVRINAKQRLLVASFILEAQQQLLFSRLQQNPSHVSGASLPFPVSTTLWDAESLEQWSLLYRRELNNCAYTHEILSYIADSVNLPQLDAFQSAHLIACQGSRDTHRHSAFDISRRFMFEQTLDNQPSTRLYYHATLIATVTPMRALLAVSGESWVWSERLSHEALSADGLYRQAKMELRQWVDDGWLRNVSTQKPVSEAVRQAMHIMAIAVDSDGGHIGIGGEVALYHAVLVLWAVTFSGISASGSGSGDERSHGSNAAVDRDKLRMWFQFAESDVETANVIGYWPSTMDVLARWKFGVDALLAWTRLRIIGNNRSSLGELAEGMVGVIGVLERRGWTGRWF
ncbi:hypothetical protein K402DRAFT_407435 [Aulographum hederae CBS 113979]|uniref:C2H2-type domain-containing protein n=1 Tax=Aulographum hederae CBS 113979 TaxID=1176131 RepID=A0A6G1GPM5_9PEZI|nr:hypothetical protein K402DRAFT_407435 [Aulographum hederae CBS 113979]